MQFGVELALLRTPPPLLGGREEQVASVRDEKRDDALTVPLRLMQYICCGNKNLAIYNYASKNSLIFPSKKLVYVVDFSYLYS